jgi:hypothetical protein
VMLLGQAPSGLLPGLHRLGIEPPAAASMCARRPCPQLPCPRQVLPGARAACGGGVALTLLGRCSALRQIRGTTSCRAMSHLRGRAAVGFPAASTQTATAPPDARLAERSTATRRKPAQLCGLLGGRLHLLNAAAIISAALVCCDDVAAIRSHLGTFAVDSTIRESSGVLGQSTPPRTSSRPRPITSTATPVAAGSPRGG